MKTVRRRAASPLLRWEPAEQDQQYRVIVRNQDTGERRSIYDGFRAECRLPPDLRLTSDQLAFRVMVRAASDPDGKFVRLHEYRPIPRVGDDLETPAADLLVGEGVTGAEQYRLYVRRPGVDRPLVDMVSPHPRFLLPPGQLRDGQYEYDILPLVRGRWRNRKRLAVTGEMIAAADERAERMVVLPPDEKRSVQGTPASTAPGRPQQFAPHAAEPHPNLLVAVDVTVHPELSPTADPSDVAERQWWSREGNGAVQSVASGLEDNGLKGVFLLDVLCLCAMPAALVRRIAERIIRRGHSVGLMINPEPWRAVSAELAKLDDCAAATLAHSRFVALLGFEPSLASLGPGLMKEDMLAQLRRLSVKLVFTDRADQLGLPSWMRWRSAPFAAYDNLVVVPNTLVLSTPAHARDRVVRHSLSALDPVMADTADILIGLERDRPNALIAARIDPMSLLRRSLVRSAAEAAAWNETIASKLPAWAEAGWERSGKGYPILADRDEIKLEMLNALLGRLGRSGIATVDWQDPELPARIRSWAETEMSYEPLVEHRRGPRRCRKSAIRRYDVAYFTALQAPPA